MTERQQRVPEQEGNYRYSFITGFTCVNIFSPDNICFDPQDILRFKFHIDRRLPGGLRIAYGIPEGYPIVNLILKNDPKPSLEMYDSTFFTLCGPFQRSEFYFRLPYIVYNIGERARQEIFDMASLHAAAVATNDGRSLLILGDKGSGKTLLSLILGLEYNFGLIGNDLILAEKSQGKLFIRAGTQIFDVRQAVIKYYLPQFEAQNLTTWSPYEEKLTLLPEEIGIAIGQDTMGLSTVIRINIHPYNNETMIEKGARKIQEILRLRENFARYIRGIVTPLVLDGESFGGYFPSLDSESLTSMRDEMIEAILRSNFIYAYGKDPRDIADKIINLL